MSRFVFARYSNQQSAEAAIQALLDEHVPPTDLGVFVQAGKRIGKVALSHETQAWSGAVAGGVVGGLVAASLIIVRLLHAIATPTVLESVRTAAIGILGGVMVGAVRGIGRWQQRARPTWAGAVGVGASVDAGSRVHISRIRAVLERTGGREIRVCRHPKGLRPLAGLEEMEEDSVQVLA